MSNVVAAPEVSSLKTAQALSRLNSLPAFSAAAVKLLAGPLNEETSVSELEVCFRSDPGMAGQLLVTANSAAFGFRAQISTIRHALNMLGMERIRSLIATIATSSYMRQFPLETVRPIWSHAVATAVIAEHLAKFSKALSPSALYTAGLTHDMGRLGLLATSRTNYQAFLRDEFENWEESDLREQDLFGVSHTLAGGMLMKVWGFPAGLCCHAEDHHVELASDTEEERIVHGACLMADAIGYPELRFRSSSQPSGVLIGQGGSVSDSCRETVELRIQEFLS